MGGNTYAYRIINICRALKVLSLGDGAFDAYKQKLIGELQVSALSIGLDEERDGDGIKSDKE